MADQSGRSSLLAGSEWISVLSDVSDYIWRDSLVFCFGGFSWKHIFLQNFMFCQKKAEEIQEIS